MKEGWKKYKLKELYSVPSRNGLTKPSRLRGQGFKMVNMGEIFAHDRIRNIEMERVPLSEKEKEGYFLQPGDLLFARQSLVISGAGKCSIFLGDNENVTFESHLIRTRFASDLINSEYLYYYFKSPIGRKKIESIVEVTAAAGIRGSDLSELEIEIPNDVNYQSEIASTLSSLDEKIKLNNEINQTLEDITQSIFKEWFINFNFPGFNATLLNGLPKGWKQGILGDVLELQYGKALKAEIRIKGQFPVIGSSGIVDYHNDFFVNGPGIVIGRKGTIGEVIWVNKNFFPIDTTFFVHDRLGANGLYYHYFLLKQQDFKKIGSDSAVPGLNRNQAQANSIVVPQREVVDEFNNTVKPFFDKKYSLESEIETLTTLRDSLLPKLMSGKIEIKT